MIAATLDSNTATFTENDITDTTIDHDVTPALPKQSSQVRLGGQRSFEYYIENFLGYLAARGKSHNTIRNYAADLNTLNVFLTTYQKQFVAMSLDDLLQYTLWLRSAKLKENSVRRKVITAKVFLRYYGHRMAIATDGLDRFPVPEKHERPSPLPSESDVEQVLKACEGGSLLEKRNETLIVVLRDTGMLVTEALKLQQSDYTAESSSILVRGKYERRVPLSERSVKALNVLIGLLGSKRYFFYGHTGGSSANSSADQPLSPRAVEVLFQSQRKQFSFKHWHPRMLRHLFVLEQMSRGVEESQIMELLGLKTRYAFKLYRELYQRVFKREYVSKNSKTL